jgi:hypothetical protein
MLPLGLGPSHGSFLAKAKRYGPIGTDEIWHSVSQYELCDIDVPPGYKRIALVDQIEHRADNQRDP